MRPAPILLSISVAWVSLFFCSSALGQIIPGHDAISPPALNRDLRTGHVPPGSFIRRPVANVHELVEQVQNDPVVGARYARLFHMSPEAVRLSFQNLVATRLPRDEVMRVYYVHGDVIGYRLRRVRAGEPIFALPNGTPVLIQVCGNALRSTLLPPALAMQVPYWSPYEEVAPVAPLIPPVVAERPLEIPAPFPFGAPTPPLVAEVAPGFVPERAVVAPTPIGAFPLFPLLAIPLLAGVGGGGGGAPFFPVPPGPVPAPAVPEPGPTAFAACAAAGLLYLRLRSTRAVARR